MVLYCRFISVAFPHLIQNSRGDRGFVVGQKASIMFGNHLGSLLTCIAGLLVRPRLFEDMGCEHIANIMRVDRRRKRDPVDFA